MKMSKGFQNLKMRKATLRRLLRRLTFLLIFGVLVLSQQNCGGPFLGYLRGEMSGNGGSYTGNSIPSSSEPSSEPLIIDPPALTQLQKIDCVAESARIRIIIADFSREGSTDLRAAILTNADALSVNAEDPSIYTKMAARTAVSVSSTTYSGDGFELRIPIENKAQPEIRVVEKGEEKIYPAICR